MFTLPFDISEAAEQVKLDIRREAVKQCDLLIDAGWKWEVPEGHDDAEPWQWYWRRPARRSGSKGMKFLSTQQAYNHLMRSQGKEPEIFA